MSSTTELGINIATGESEENLDKLAAGMESVLDKYIKLMEASGRAEEAFKKISKAIGLHNATLKEMSSETVKAMAVLGPEVKKVQDMTVRGLSTNITKQFTKLSSDLTKVFAQIPQEIAKSMQDVGSGFLAATDGINKGVSSIGRGMGYINNSIGGLRTELNDLIDVISTVEKATGKLQDGTKKGIKTTTKAVAQELAGDDRKTLFNTAAGVIPRSEEDTLRAIKAIAAETEKARKTLYAGIFSKGFLDPKDIEQYQRILTSVNKETKELSRANIDMAGDAGMALTELRTNVGKLNEEFKGAKISSKKNFMQAMGISVPELSAVQNGIKSLAAELNGLSPGDLKLPELIRYQNILKELGADAKRTGSSAERRAVGFLKEDVDNAIKVRMEADALSDAAKDTAKATKESEHNIKSIRGVLDAASHSAETTAQALNSIKSGSTQAQFADLNKLKEYKDTLYTTYDTLKQLKAQVRSSGDVRLFDEWAASMKDVEAQMETFKRVMTGMSPNGMGGLTNPQSIEFKEQIELLQKIRTLTDNIATSQKKLSDSRGNKTATADAKRELQSYESLKQTLATGQKDFAKDMKGIGIVGSKAVEEINKAMGHLGATFGSFSSQIRSTESSFKGMWGGVTMAFGKFLLFRHTIGVVLGDIRGIFDMVKNSLDSVMRQGEVFSNAQKVFKTAEGGNLNKAGEDWARLTQQAEYYGMAVSDLIPSYQKWLFTIKETNMNAKEGWKLYEHMIAASKPLGIVDSQQLNEYFAGLTQMIGKGKVSMEEFRQQLSEKIPGLYFSVKEALSKALNIDPKKFNFEKLISDNKIPLNDFIAAIDTSLIKFAKMGESMSDSYTSAVNRMKNAWQTFMADMANGPVGQKITQIVVDITEAFKDRDFQTAIANVISAFATVASTMTKLVTTVLPTVMAKLRQMVGDDKIAESNPALYNAGFMTATKSGSSLLNSSNTAASMILGVPSLSASRPNVSAIQTLTADVAGDNVTDLIRKGFLYKNNEGILTAAKSAEEAFQHQLQISKDATSEELSAMVLDPLVTTMDALKTDYKGLREQLIKTAIDLELSSSGDWGRLLGAQQTSIEDSNRKAAAAGKFYTITGSLSPYIGSTTERMDSMAEASKKPGVFIQGSKSTVDPSKLNLPISKVTSEDTEAKIKAFKKGLENIQNEINKASMGKWAYEFSEVTHKVKELEIELGDKAAPEIQALGEALKKDFFRNLTKGIDEFDSSLDQKIRTGKYGKELQTATDSVMKDYRDNLQKIDDEYRDVSLIPGMSEDAIEKVKQFTAKAAEARKSGFENILAESTMTEKTLADAQAAGAENTVRRIAAIRNTETKDVIDNLKTIINETDRVSNEGTSRRIADIERAGEVARKEGMAELDVYYEVERMKQDLVDKNIDKKISNSGTFEEYLSMRFGKEQGLFDGPVAATQKQFEKMYDHIGSGAEEMGKTLETAFTDSFTGTLKSWTDVWKQIQATFLKTLAGMIWEAKARPITVSIASALTGIAPTTALAGGTTAGNIASQAHDFVTGGSQTSTGLISKMTNSIDKMTKSLNDFGKETLGLSTDLTHAIAGGGLGFAIGSMMFPDNVTAKIGAAIGGAAGEVIGETYGGPIGGAIGSAAGSVIGGAIGKFFTGEKKITDYGIRVSVDDEGLKFLDKYEKIKKSSSFNLSAVFKPSFYTDPGSAWSVGSKKERYTEVDPQVYKQISAAITTSFSTVSRQMLSLGLAPNFAGFSIDEKVSLKGKDPEALLQAWLNKLSGKMVDTALANDSVQASFAAAKKMGETSSDALTRLVEAMTALESGAIKANVSIEALAGGLSGIDLASFASDFSEALGGSSNVSAFFDQISEFIGYVGIQGISNMTKFQEKFETAIGNINSYTGMSGSRTSTLLGQQTELGLTQSFIENKLEKFAAGAGWSKWLTFEGGELTMRPGSKYSTVEEMAAADPKWKAVLDPMIAYVKELKVTNQALENVAIKIDREAATAPVEAINASSATFWTDYTKALEKAKETGGMPPELASAWFAAGQVAEAMKEQREAAIAAREEIEKQTVSYNEQRQTLQLSAQYFGASANGLIAISREAEALNQNDLPTWFEESKNAVVEGLVPGLMSFNRTGETAFNTLIRLTNVFKTTEQAAALAGTSLETLSGGKTGLGAANYAQGLIDYFGGQDTVTSMLGNIGSAIYTDDALSAIATEYWKKQALAQASALGAGDSIDAIKAWIKKQLATGDLTGSQLSSINILATSVNNLEAASGTAADSVESLADYMKSITDKIAKLGMTDTESFMFDLSEEVKQMKDKILELGGTETDALIADQYRVAAVTQKLSEMMEDVGKSIRKLTSSDLVEQINSLSDSYWEQVNSAKLLGATQEQLNAILYNAYLQAVQILKSAAQAYIQAYDNTVSKIEELKGKQQALEDDVDTARSDYMASLQKEIDLKQEAIDKLQDNVDALKDFIGDLKDLKSELLTSVGILSPTEKAGITMSQFSQTAALAASGDTTARGNVSSQAQAALESAAGGSYDDYIKSFAQIYGTVNSLQNSAQASLDPQQVQLDALIASRDQLQSIYDILKEEADKTKSIADAQDAYDKAKIALANSTYAAQISVLQATVDQHTAIVEELRKQYNQDTDLATAAKDYFDIKGIIERAVPDVTTLIANMSTSLSGVLSESTKDSISEAIQTYQQQIATDTKNSSKTIENSYKLLAEIQDVLEPVETTDKTDRGIKTIVAAASVRDGVLLALRQANNLATVDASSVVGLLNTLTTCACGGSTPGTTCPTVTAATACGELSGPVTVVADTSGLATTVTDKVFADVERSLVYVRDFGGASVRDVTLRFVWEDPDCVDVSYIIV